MRWITQVNLPSVHCSTACLLGQRDLAGDLVWLNGSMQASGAVAVSTRAGTWLWGNVGSGSCGELSGCFENHRYRAGRASTHPRPQIDAGRGKRT